MKRNSFTDKKVVRNKDDVALMAPPIICPNPFYGE